MSLQLTQAQIIYNDVNPDVTINNNGIYPLDLNNDSIIDFYISYTNVFPGACSDIAQLNYFVRITPANFNAIANSNNMPLWPIKLDSNMVIDKNLVWKKDASQILFNMNWICQNEYWTGYSNGHWINATNKFLPLRLRIAGNNYYGWLGIDVTGINTSFGSFRIRDYAYNSAAGKAILAGETACTEPLVTIAASAPLSFCTGDSVVLTANSNAYSYQWKRNGVNIAGATTSNYTATSDGIYKVRVANSCGSKNSLCKTIATPCKLNSSILLPHETAHLSVYPNPVKDGHFTIQLPTDEASTLQITDAFGKSVFKATTLATEIFIDATYFSAGIYTARWTNGVQTETRTFGVIK